MLMTDEQSSLREAGMPHASQNISKPEAAFAEQVAQAVPEQSQVEPEYHRLCQADSIGRQIAGTYLQIYGIQTMGTGIVVSAAGMGARVGGLSDSARSAAILSGPIFEYGRHVLNFGADMTADAANRSCRIR